MNSEHPVLSEEDLRALVEYFEILIELDRENNDRGDSSVK